MNEAKSAKFGAESARTGAENAKAAAQASATAAAQSAAQAEEAAESIEESADLVQKLMDNQIKDTATGTIATYPDGADMPMVSLVADIDPIQDTSGGAPSPSHICPISGWDSVDVVVSPTQDAQDGTTYTTTLPQTVYGGTLDVVSGVLTVDRAMRVLDGSTDENWSVQASGGHYRAYTYSLTDILPHSSNTQPTSAICNMYEAGTWSDVFGGQPYLGQTGKAIGIGIDGLGITDVTTWNAWLADNPLEVVYTLATTTTIQLTPTQIDSLLGRNSVWADSGDVTVEYIADTKLYIQKVIS